MPFFAFGCQDTRPIDINYSVQFHGLYEIPLSSGELYVRLRIATAHKYLARADYEVNLAKFLPHFLGVMPGAMNMSKYKKISLVDEEWKEGVTSATTSAVRI